MKTGPAFALLIPTKTDASGNVIAQNVYPGINKLEYFANNAPSQIPGWFDHKRAPDEPKDIKTADYIIWMGIDHEARYFQWRIYYATKLIEELNKTQQ